jgi:hypothetical protein
VSTRVPSRPPDKDESEPDKGEARHHSAAREADKTTCSDVIRVVDCYKGNADRHKTNKDREMLRFLFLTHPPSEFADCCCIAKAEQSFSRLCDVTCVGGRPRDG